MSTIEAVGLTITGIVSHIAAHGSAAVVGSSSLIEPNRRSITIARRRYFRPQENFVRGPRINEQIRKSPIRLINEHDEMMGVVDTGDALQRAREAGLDLVEVAADSDPPVCRIMDFGKWKYEQSKKEKAQKAKSKHTELKEVRMGRSMKIDPHDIEIRLTQARRFLIDGHKVQIVQNFRGREMVHRDRGHDRMQSIIDRLSDVGKLETPPRLNGRRMTMILAPDRTKIERIKRREASANKAKGEPADDAGTAKPQEQGEAGEAAGKPAERAAAG